VNETKIGKLCHTFSAHWLLVVLHAERYPAALFNGLAPSQAHLCLDLLKGATICLGSLDELYNNRLLRCPSSRLCVLFDGLWEWLASDDKRTEAILFCEKVAQKNIF
jgi:hypothetical protein